MGEGRDGLKKAPESHYMCPFLGKDPTHAPISVNKVLLENSYVCPFAYILSVADFLIFFNVYLLFLMERESVSRRRAEREGDTDLK